MSVCTGDANTFLHHLPAGEKPVSFITFSTTMSSNLHVEQLLGSRSIALSKIFSKLLLMALWIVSLALASSKTVLS